MPLIAPKSTQNIRTERLRAGADPFSFPVLAALWADIYIAPFRRFYDLDLLLVYMDRVLGSTKPYKMSTTSMIRQKTKDKKMIAAMTCGTSFIKMAFRANWSHSGNGKNSFNDDHPTQQAPKSIAKYGDDRQKRIAQSMTNNDFAFGNAFCSCCAYIVLPDCFNMVEREKRRIEAA